MQEKMPPISFRYITARPVFSKSDNKLVLRMRKS